MDDTKSTTTSLSEESCASSDCPTWSGSEIELKKLFFAWDVPATGGFDGGYEFGIAISGILLKKLHKGKSLSCLSNMLKEWGGALQPLALQAMSIKVY